VIESPEAVVTEYALRFKFKSSNNEAGNEAVISYFTIRGRQEQ